MKTYPVRLLGISALVRSVDVLGCADQLPSRLLCCRTKHESLALVLLDTSRGIQVGIEPFRICHGDDYDR